MKWVLLFEIVYVIVILLVIFRVLLDTRSGVKALAYILFIILIPFVGMIFYLFFGINYRKRKLYSRKIVEDEVLRQEILNRTRSYSDQLIQSGLLSPNHHNMARFIQNTSTSPLTGNNSVKLLLNGEQKFPVLLEALENAKSHIHLEYYIFENDKTGHSIADILIKKAQEGVKVRFMYDDFGSRALGKDFINRLEENGVETAPFYKIRWYTFASQLNYRNHRKIIIIDGTKSFIGGINISDRYRNEILEKDHLFWRDTHLMLDGPATFYLQYLFLCDWNFNAKIKFHFRSDYFPNYPEKVHIQEELVQIVSSGPDSKLPVIFYSMMKAIGSAKKQVLMSSPYFIPGESLMDSLIIAAKSGIEIMLLIPGISDSMLVNSAARSYYTELLRQGVRIFEYQKGFIHAKVMIVDDILSVVGSANLDYRSFDLNFEVNAMLYSKSITDELKKSFYSDLEHSCEINPTDWINRPKYIHLYEKMLRLFAPIL